MHGEECLVKTWTPEEESHVTRGHFGIIHIKDREYQGFQKLEETGGILCYGFQRERKPANTLILDFYSLKL